MRKLWNNGLTRGSNYYIRKKIVENSRRQQATVPIAQDDTNSGYSYPSRPPLPPEHPVYQAWACGELPDDL